MLGRVVAGRYRLEARVGEGGMGVVYRARHVLIDRVVALKLIRPDLRGETHLRAWMLREARAANRVDHAHIIDIHDIGETEEGELYLVMEYLVGTALSSELAQGPDAARARASTSSSRCAPRSRAPTTSASSTAISRATTSCSSTRGGRKDFVKILDFGLAHLAHGPAPRAEGRGVRNARVHVARAGARRRGRPAERSLRARRPVLRDAHRAAPLPLERSRHAARDAAHARRRRKPARDQAGRRSRRPRPSSSSCSRRSAASATRTPTISTRSSRRCSARCRRTPWEVRPTPASRAAAAAAAAAVAGRHRVGEPRRALLAHGEPRVPVGQRAAGDPDGARAGVGSRRARHAPRGRGREPHAQARVARATRSRAPRRDRPQGRGARARRVARAARRRRRAARGGEAPRARSRSPSATRRTAKAQADQAAQQGGNGATLRAIFERAGAAAALLEARREQLAEREQKAAVKDAQARDLRRQIDELRAQLARYAEALEEDLAAGREKVAVAHARGPQLREGVQRRRRRCS